MASEEELQKLGIEIVEAIENWFKHYDWDEAFERMLRKYEGLQLGFRLPTWA